MTGGVSLPRRGPRDTSCRVGVLLVERLVLEQGRDERVEPAPVLLQQVDYLLMGFLDDAAHLVVDELLRGGRDLGDTRKQGAGAVAWENGDRPDRRAHPPPPDHLARDLRELLDVRLGATTRLPEDDLFGGASAERDFDPRLHL